MKNRLLFLYLKKLQDFDDFYLILLLYMAINTFVSVIQEENLILIVSFALIIIIIALKWLLEKYKNNLFKIGKEAMFLLLNCTIVIIQRNFGHQKENTIDFFEIINMIYGEFLIFSILSFKIIQVFSFIFYLIINIICLNLQPNQIAYLILIKMAIFLIFQNKFVKKDRRKKKITFVKEKFNFKYNHERTFIVNQKIEFNLIHCDYKKGVKEDLISRLQNLNIYVLGEYCHIPSEVEFKNCVIQNKKPEVPINLKNFIEKINDRNAKALNVFFIAEGRFFSETENDIIILYKMINDKLMLKIRKDILYDQLSKIRQTNSNYSRAISFVAHEFKTPLNCIVSMLQTLDQQIDPKLSSNLIVPALISSKFLLNMVSDLLDIAQIEAEKFKLVNIDFDLRFLMQDTLQIVVFQAMKRGLELKMNFDNAIKRFKSDPNRIRQILINLLGSITLSAKKISSHQTQISVEDTGLGIDTVNLENLFKAFGKVTNPADSALNAQGVGLGLLISNKLALILNEMEEGIKVESELNKGSKFYFSIFDFSPQEQITLSSHRIGHINIKECKLLETCGNYKKKKDTHCLLNNLQKSSENISDLPSLNDTDTLLIMPANERSSYLKSESFKKVDTFILTSLTSSCFFLSDFHSLKKTRHAKFSSHTNQLKPEQFSIIESLKDNVNEENSNFINNSFHTLNELESPKSIHRKDGMKSSKEENAEFHEKKKKKTNCETSHQQEISCNNLKNQKLSSENNLSCSGSDSANNNKSKFFVLQSNQLNNSSNCLESVAMASPKSPQVKIETPGQKELNSKPKFSTGKTSNFDSSDKKSQIDFQIENIRNIMHSKKCKCPSVLVVDDNDFNILALTSHLGRLGINCYSALSGDEAIKQIHELYEKGEENKLKKEKTLEEGKRRRTDFPHDINDQRKKNEQRSKTEIRPNGTPNRTIKIVIDERKKLFVDSADRSDSKNKPYEKESNSESVCCNYFKVIFLDLEMPGKNGLETFEIILKFYKRKMMLENLNVIAVTAYDRNNETVTQMLDKGVKDVIVKPVSVEVVALSLELDWLESQ